MFADFRQLLWRGAASRLPGLRAPVMAGLLLGAGTVSAGTEIFDDTVSTCTSMNCSSLRIPGSILNHVDVSPKPWVAQLFKEVTDCMRLDVVSQDADLEIVAIAPDGTMYRNDDRVPGSDLRPLVKIASGTAKGWYTVHIGVFNGDRLEPNFTLLYGRYSAGNPNCSTSTAPLLTSGGPEAEEKDEMEVRAPKAGAPGAQ